MPYHVEIRRSVRRAWAFNLSEERLREAIVEPWLSGRQVELGDRRWDPRESSLRIIEGAELAPQDLAYGQGWNAAERGGEEVTRRLLEQGAATVRAVTVVGETPAAGEAAAEVLRAAGFRATVVERPADGP